MIRFVQSEDHVLTYKFLTILKEIPLSKSSRVENSVLLINMTQDMFLNLYPAANLTLLEDEFDSIFFTKDNNVSTTLHDLISDITSMPLVNKSKVRILTDEQAFAYCDNPDSSLITLNQFLDNKKSSLTFYVFGQNIANLVLPVTKSSCFQIQSSSLLYNSPDGKSICKIFYEHSDIGIITNSYYQFCLETSFVQKLGSKINLDCAYNQNNRFNGLNEVEIISTRAIYRKNELKQNNLEIFNNISAMNHGALKKEQAIIIFPCLTYSDVEYIYRCCHEIKSHNKQNIILIIREVNKCLRHIDKQFLIKNGVDYILPYKLSISDCNDMLEAIKNIHFKIITTSSNRVSFTPPANDKGVISIEKFSLNVKALVTYHIQQNIEFSLAELVINSDISPDDCIEYCKANRSGDLISYLDQSIYIFFSATNVNDVKHAVSNAFSIKVDTLFKSINIASNIKSITSILTKLELEQGTELKPRLITEKVKSESEVKSSDKKLAPDSKLKQQYARRMIIERPKEKASS